jgi:hypothetical protein
MQNSNLEIQHLVSHNTDSKATFSRSGLYIKTKICKEYQSHIHTNIKIDINGIDENIMITVSFEKEKIKKKAYTTHSFKNKHEELKTIHLKPKRLDTTGLFNPLFELLENSNNAEFEKHCWEIMYRTKYNADAYLFSPNIPLKQRRKNLLTY